ncbi:unnamed protein product [Calypogeia fissa]
MHQFHAALVHHGFPKDISPANFNKRFQRYVARYKEACEFKTQSGGGLSEDELAVGMTLEEKLNKLCPHFERMHGIYGGRPNVRPDLEADVGVNAHDYIFPEESGDTNARLLEAAREHLAKENMNPNQQGEYTPTQLLPGNHTGSPSESFYSAPALVDVLEVVPTPTTLYNAQVDAQFWKDMREFEQATLIRHNNSCQCLECRGPHGVQTGESCPAPTESANNQPVLGDTPPARQAPPKKGGKAFAASGKEKVPPKDKPVLKEKPDNVLKPSFAAIYAEKNAQKADFRLNLIQSRDKWKSEDLEERRQARLEAAERHRADRDHQVFLQDVAAQNTAKKSKADQQYALEMALESRQTSLLNTLFASNKTPEEIQALLPLIKG